MGLQEGTRQCEDAGGVISYHDPAAQPFTEEVSPQSFKRGRGAFHLELALDEQRAEVGDALSGDGVALGLVLGHLILQGDQADGGTLLLLQAEELQDALVVLHVAVDEYEEDLEEGDQQGFLLTLGPNQASGSLGGSERLPGP